MQFLLSNSSTTSGHQAVKRLVNSNSVKRGSPKVSSNKKKKVIAKKPVSLNERTELSIMFDKIRQKNKSRAVAKIIQSEAQTNIKPNVCTVENGHINENIDRFDHDNLMEFDERGRLRPKNSQKVLACATDMEHAPKLELKVKNSHENSPEKLSCQSKISIFEMKSTTEENIVNYKTKSSKSPNINFTKMSQCNIERSSSFSTLVGKSTDDFGNLSRKLCESEGANLDKKNRKESINILTPSTPIGRNLEKESLNTDSPGKRKKMSPEYSNLYFKKLRSGKRTMGDT